MSGHFRRQWTSVGVLLSLLTGGLVAAALASPRGGQRVERQYPSAHQRVRTARAEALLARRLFPFGVPARGSEPVLEPDPANVGENGNGPSVVWGRRYKVGNGSDLVDDMVVGPDKSVYLTGQTKVFVDGVNPDLITMKIGADGQVEWRRIFESSPEGYHWGGGLAHDSQGNVYVAGYFHTNGFFQTAIALKYTAEGRLDWHKLLDAGDLGGDGNAAAVDVAVDEFDNAYFLITAALNGSRNDVVTLKVDPLGNELGLFRYPGRRGISEDALEIQVDPFGDLVISAGAWNELNGRDFLTLKYSPEGELLWQRRNRPSTRGYDRPAELKITDDGDVLHAGTRSRFLPNGSLVRDVLVIKYSRHGAVQWKRLHKSPVDFAVGSSVDVDAQGNVFVGGTSDEGPYESGRTEYDFVLAKFSPQGQTTWKTFWKGTPSWSRDRAMKVRTTADGGAIVAGQGRTKASSDLDYVLVRYSAQGKILWTRRHVGAGNNDFLQFMELDGDGGIYVSGYIWTGEEHDILTAKFE